MKERDKPGAALSTPALTRLVDAAERLGSLRRLGPMRVHERFAVGGMASIHFAWLLGSKRLVALKKLHPHLLADETFTKMLLDEARLAMQVEHPNVVSTLGIGIATTTTDDQELLVAMDYVPGSSLAEILMSVRPRGIAPRYAAAILQAALAGLHAAHQARGGDGNTLGIVHRDVSPQNVLLGADGVGRVVDFGVAKAEARLQSTEGAIIKGKLPYLSPEQLSGQLVDARSDVYSASVVLWEALTARPLFHAGTASATLRRIFSDNVSSPRTFVPAIPAALDAVVMRGLSRDPGARFESAEAMADALGRAVPTASAEELGAHLATLAVQNQIDRERLAELVRAREAAGN